MRRALIVICGATATGKSALAIELAKKINSVIISADSRQIYQEFDIGTAKPTIKQQLTIPHFLIDICQPTTTLTLAQYQEQAQNLIAYYQQFTIPLLVGGTGLYIKSIIKGLEIPKVSPQPELRSQLATLGQSQLYAMLTQIDPNAASNIHPNDQVRTLRALEVFYVTGKPISQQQGENPPPYTILQIGLDCDPSSESPLELRIRQRTQQMLSQGLVTEVTNLIGKYGWDLPLLNTLGYAEIKQYLQGTVSLEEATELIVIHTRQFAKRQRTWFRADPDIIWFNLNQNSLVDYVWSYLKLIIDNF